MINYSYIILYIFVIILGFGYANITDIALAFVVIGLFAVISDITAKSTIVDFELVQFKNTISSGYNNSKQEWNILVDEIDFLISKY